MYRDRDYVMIPRFNARASDINLQIDLIRMSSLPVEKVLQHNEEGLAEDERLTHLASLPDLEGFTVAMDPKKDSGRRPKCRSGFSTSRRRSSTSKRPTIKGYAR